MVQAEEISVLLHPWLGKALLLRSDVCEKAVALLNGFMPEAGNLESLEKSLDTLLFRTVHSMTQGDMRILLDDGRIVRVRMDDFAMMADDLLYLKMREISRMPRGYERIRSYAMSHSSLAALRALLVDLASMQSEEELAAVAQTVRSCHPPFRWQYWLQN